MFEKDDRFRLFLFDFLVFVIQLFPLMIKFIKSTPLTVIFRNIKCLTIDTSNNNLSDMLSIARLSDIV